MSSLPDKKGKVFLVGAGPGDPKLLTIKAAEVIADSDVIVFDYLVNPQILNHVRKGAELIYAGKRAGEESVSQADIIDLLIRRAWRGDTVTRLKGGDPFIFGRGGEEAEALAKAGIEWEVVPGISSGIAAPAYAGIPLTHRGYSSSVAFITGHAADKDAVIDWAAIAKLAETLVIFMCAGTIRSIARRLIENGRSGSTPIAIIRWGSYPRQEVYTATLGAIAGVTPEGSHHFKPPALAVVGEVVSLRNKLDWFGGRAAELFPLNEFEKETVTW